jgi:tRNA threonylcarbamoyladenosine biosynthesis protein TsaE
LDPVAITFELPGAADTAGLGAAMARGVMNARALVERDGLVIGLSGDLGAGKTTLVRGMLQSLGVEGHIKSPTYVLLEPYTIEGLDFYHIDFYRIKDPREFLSGGFREFFGDRRVCLIEWPEKAGEHLSEPDLLVQLQIRDEARIAHLQAQTGTGRECLRNWIRMPGQTRAGA